MPCLSWLGWLGELDLAWLGCGWLGRLDLAWLACGWHGFAWVSLTCVLGGLAWQLGWPGWPGWLALLVLARLAWQT